VNVVLICLDTHRADCVRALGRNRVIQTPHLDRLAREGVTFQNAFGEGQPTIEFRRALITGRRTFPWRHDVDTRGLWPTLNGWHAVAPQHDTLAEILLEQGYTTGFFSDTFHMFKPTQNFTRGFTSWEFIRGQETDNWRVGPLDAIDLQRYLPPGSDPDPRKNPRLVQYLLNMQDRETADDWTSAKVFDAACRFVRDARDSQPFFLWVDSFDPHEPWDPPPGYAEKYDPDWDRPWEPIWRETGSDARARARCKALYYGECTFVDELVGRLLDTLDEFGLADDTLVIATSDHGTELWDHGEVGKNVHNCRYRHNNEILWLMRLPGREHAGRKVAAFVQNQDVVPTVLALAGIPWEPLNAPHRPTGAPDAERGRSVLPLLTGERDHLRDAAITGWRERANVRTFEFSYSVDYAAFGSEPPADDEPNEHLFNLRSDPAETKNVAADHPDVCTWARSKLETLLGQPLPATLEDKLYPTQMPCRVWIRNAPLFRS
jgi:arylsulfatase A-like enzyme